ncbi:hypothetical protein BEN78_03590 [Xanthomonas citri pv. mangiferaeindicae]|nr:hypothetical protein BEN78_03590 [Xanthomonas citri pv. mangiferaeindicae]
MTVAAKFEIEDLHGLGPDSTRVAPLRKAFAAPATRPSLLVRRLFVRTFDSKAIALQRTGEVGSDAACVGHEAPRVARCAGTGGEAARCLAMRDDLARPH